MTYLDHAASSPLRPEARAAMEQAFSLIGNPASVHGAGREVRAAVEGARRDVAALAGASAAQVIFTSGGTEAVETALRGLAMETGPWLVSAVEHACVLGGAVPVETIPVDGQGVVLLAALEKRLAHGPRPAGVAVMYANNETGVRQPVAEAAKFAHDAGLPLLCDAVQGAGKVGIDLVALGADALAISAHKFGGPQGVGALIVAQPERMAPLIVGGGQERGKRGGTPNTLGIVGFGVAARAAMAAREEEGRRIAALQSRLEEGVGHYSSDALIWAATAERLPGVLSVWLPGVDRQTQVMAFDLAGVAVSAGAACSSGKTVPSSVLLAMGASKKQAAESIRVSLGWNSEESDVAAFLEVWERLAGKRPSSHS